MICLKVALIAVLASAANAQREFVYPEDNDKFSDSLTTPADRTDLGGFGGILKFGISMVAIAYLAVTVILPFFGVNLLTAGKRQFRTLASDDSFISNIVNSIDPVEATFRFMDIKDENCRKREVCRFHSNVSDDNTLASILGSISNKLESLTKYRDAVKAGTDGLQCDQVFTCLDDKKASLKTNHRSRVLQH